MQEAVKVAFEQQVVMIPLAKILPSRVLAPEIKERVKYKRIVASVLQLGLIEPLVVSRQQGDSYLLLDGHIRFEALREQHEVEARCIVAEDDEAFTYNKRVNRLATIQEHYMIVRALACGALGSSVITFPLRNTRSAPGARIPQNNAAQTSFMWVQYNERLLSHTATLEGCRLL